LTVKKLQITLYTVLVQRINDTFTHQLQIFHVFRKLHTMQALKYASLPHRLTSMTNKKDKI